MPITTSRAPACARAGDRFVDHRHHRVHALDREALHVHEREAEEALEAIHLRHAAEQGALLLGGEGRGQPLGFDRLTEPLALFLFLEVVVLEADRAAPQLPHARDDVRGGACRAAERLGRDLREIGLGDSVEGRRHLGGADRRRAERVDLDAHVPVALDRADEPGRSGNFAQQIRVGRSPGRGGRSGRRRAGELLGEAEILAPALVYRSRIATELLVQVCDITVVVHANRWLTHTLKYTGLTSGLYRYSSMRSCKAELPGHNSSNGISTSGRDTVRFTACISFAPLSR